METYKLYNGDVTLTFDPEKHVYRVGENIIPGVTTVCEIAANQGWRIPWAAKMCAEYLSVNLKPGKALDEIEIKSLADTMRRVPRSTAKKAADIGSLVHDYIEGVIRHKLNQGELPSKPVNAQANNAIDQFARWVKENKVYFHASEAKVCSRKYKYAGTLDIDATVNGERCIVDIKTSKIMADEYRLQTAAYQQARQEELQVRYAKRWIVRVPKDGSDLEIKPYEDFTGDFDAFLAALTIVNWRNRLRAA